ncbi:hypothetical protein JF770_16460 [Mycobacterium intracellulare]|uniref:hypothetical protein n=1 Tax=Mycobacterium intracellulare TaxID=1767 RepID=UPI001CD98612|nr:hypothetical protein [Mycobacterium intracellulare]MCA2305158.1 hypothetical protein [Mycobacterium intracellulare]MCA2347480.1 hypothetical protein [Mycobacterium intracellulare]
MIDDMVRPVQQLFQAIHADDNGDRPEAPRAIVSITTLMKGTHGRDSQGRSKVELMR